MKLFKSVVLFLIVFFMVSFPCFASQFGVLYLIPNGCYKSVSDHTLNPSTFAWHCNGAGTILIPLEVGAAPPANNWFDSSRDSQSVNYLKPGEVLGGRVHDTHNIYYFVIEHGGGGQYLKTITSDPFKVPEGDYKNGVVTIIVNCQNNGSPGGVWYALLKCEKVDGSVIYYKIRITVA